MRKRGSTVCKLLPCLPKGPTNSARMRTMVTVELQRQYLQKELILWIRLVQVEIFNMPLYVETTVSEEAKQPIRNIS
jgi:hypothetical protein